MRAYLGLLAGLNKHPRLVRESNREEAQILFFLPAKLTNLTVARGFLVIGKFRCRTAPEAITTIAAL